MSAITKMSEKRCLVTGGLGYLGLYVVQALLRDNWAVETLGLKSDNHFVCDLSKSQPEFSQPFDLVVHCAGLAHFFPRNTDEERRFFEVNVEGTKQLLGALQTLPQKPKRFILMSSVSVYGADSGEEIGETAPLNAKSAYGLSKIEAEYAVEHWCKTNAVNFLILRLPLLAGKNPPGNLKALINSIKKGYYFNLFGKVRKSIVHVDDVANLIAQNFEASGIFNLTDGEHPTVAQLSDMIAAQLGKKSPLIITSWIANALKFVVNRLSFLAPIQAYKLEKLSRTLTFDDSKARRELGWNPKRVLDVFKIS